MEHPNKPPDDQGRRSDRIGDYEKALLEAIRNIRDQGKRLEKEAERVRYLDDVAPSFERVCEATRKMYSSKRWRLVVAWEKFRKRFSGKEASEGYLPLDNELARLAKKLEKARPKTGGETNPELQTEALVTKHADFTAGPLVSVVMTAYQREASIRHAVRSVLGQRYQTWELIVVDDGSTDGTEAAIRSFDDQRIRYVKRAHEGRSASLNAGLTTARGDLVAYLDTDNNWQPDLLSVLVGELLGHPGFRAAFCAREKILECHGEQAPLGIHYCPYSRALLENRNLIDLNGLVHFRDAAEDAGGFEPRLTRMVDWEFALQLTKERSALAVPASLYQYRMSPDNGPITFREERGKNEAIVQESLAQNPIHLSESAQQVVGSYQLYSNMAPPRVGRHARRPVSIVIPNWGVPECLRLCLESVEKFSSDHDYEVIIVDNASESPQSRSLLSELEEAGDVTVVRNRANMGFTYAVNQGIMRAADGRDIVLLNNDAVATDGWLDGFMEARAAFPKAALIAPRQVLLPGEETNKTHVAACNMERETDVTLSRHHDNVIAAPPHVRGYVPLRFAPFFCVYLCDWTVEKIGYLDYENGRHYRSDWYYCEEIRRRGYEIVYTPHAKLYHLLQRATVELRKNEEEFETMFVNNAWDEGEMPADVR